MEARDAKYIPAYDPANAREPTEPEKKLDEVFQRFIEEEIKLESNEEMIRRDNVLSEVRSIFLNWVQFVATDILHIPQEVAEDAGGELFISGSHRLGVRDIGADIDTVCVAPNFCTKQHFFTYLKEDLLKRPEVTDLNAVETAFVPLISFDFRGVSIDLLFARLAQNSVPKDLDILDDNILIGLDEPTEKSLNGPRVTNMIFKLVGEKTFPNFLIVLRCIRKWAKRRGIYGNKLGYLGGVNCNILVAFICQLYPNFTPSALLLRFFNQYKKWEWPQPIMLNNIQQNPFGQLATEERPVWSPVVNANDLMPIITPAYPAMNSAFNVSPHSLLVMQNEIAQGYAFCESILKKNAWQDINNWKKLFEPSHFFVRYHHYLACHIIGTGDNAESRGWIGFVESRIRRFIQHPFLSTLPLLPPIHLHPVVSKTAKSVNSLCYFIGFNIDYDLIAKLGNNNIHIDDCVARFQESLLDPDKGYQGERAEGLDFYVEHLSWKKLPKEVFEIYGGFEAAKALREENGYHIRQENTKLVIAQEGAAAPTDPNAATSAATTATTAAATATPGRPAPITAAALLQQATLNKVNEEELREKKSQEKFQKKVKLIGLDLEKALAVKNGQHGMPVPSHHVSFDELKKRFCAAAVGVESNKRRKFDSNHIVDEWATFHPTEIEENEEKDVFTLQSNSQPLSSANHPNSFVIPNITWTLLDHK